MVPPPSSWNTFDVISVITSSALLLHQHYYFISIITSSALLLHQHYYFMASTEEQSRNTPDLQRHEIKRGWLEIALSEDERTFARGVGLIWARGAGLDPKSAYVPASELSAIMEQARAEMAFSKATGRYFVTDRLVTPAVPAVPASDYDAAFNGPPEAPAVPESRNPFLPARCDIDVRGGRYYPYDVVIVQWRPEDPGVVLGHFNPYDNFCFVSEVGSYFYVTGYALGKHVTARGKPVPGGFELSPHNFEAPINLRVIYRPVDIAGETRELMDVERKEIEKKGGREALGGFA